MGRLPTLGDQAAAGTDVTATCGNSDCGHRGPVDLPRLIARFGEKAPLAKLKARLRCTRCGGRGGTFSLHANAG